MTVTKPAVALFAWFAPGLLTGLFAAFDRRTELVNES